ncbi:ABC transporter C family member 12-like [Argopecten irradians]|uniref:ABC transporter C family member 12-like n=1 Tax=Argopecten irradians TaxID=31199 RepID=UPI003713D24F
MTSNQQQAHTRLEDQYSPDLKGILTERETAEVGSISKDVYLSYIRAAGGKLVVVFLVLMYAASVSSVVISDWWLGLWIEDTTSDKDTFVYSSPNTTGLNALNTDNATSPSAGSTSLVEDTDWFTVYVYSAIGITALAISNAIIAGFVSDLLSFFYVK